MAAVLAFALALGSPAGHATADAACDSAKDVCACSALGVHCGWCSSSSSCRKAPVCTTTCRECPYATGAATSPSCPACAATCIDTCPAARSVCACAELSGCGWCNTTQRCAVYPECTTTCEVRRQRGADERARARVGRHPRILRRRARAARPAPCRSARASAAARPAPSTASSTSTRTRARRRSGRSVRRTARKRTARRRAAAAPRMPPARGRPAHGRVRSAPARPRPPPSPPPRAPPPARPCAVRAGREDVATTVAIFLAVVMASAAGIGGGAVLVPLFTMLGGFTEHEAIPLSIATIFGGSAFSVFFNFGSMPHPLSPRRHCIAYDAAVILLPMTLAGVTVGVYLNKVGARRTARAARRGARASGRARAQRARAPRGCTLACAAASAAGVPQLADHAAAGGAVRLHGAAHAAHGPQGVRPGVGRARGGEGGEARGGRRGARGAWQRL